MSTAYAQPGGMAGLIAPSTSTAQSDPAKTLGKMQESIRRHLLESYALSISAEKALAELEVVRNEASWADWDGYGALPMEPLAYAFARRFLNSLPTTSPFPEVSADTDGEVSLDWSFGTRRALTVSISATGRCSFAWILGQNTTHGTGWIEDEIPATIVFALGQLARDTHGLRHL
jgi:hypothetical protein